MMIISRYCEFVAYDALIVDKAKGHDTTDDIPKYSKHVETKIDDTHPETPRSPEVPGSSTSGTRRHGRLSHGSSWGNVGGT